MTTASNENQKLKIFAQRKHVSRSYVVLSGKNKDKFGRFLSIDLKTMIWQKNWMGKSIYVKKIK